MSFRICIHGIKCIWFVGEVDKDSNFIEINKKFIEVFFNYSVFGSYVLRFKNFFKDFSSLKPRNPQKNPLQLFIKQSKPFNFVAQSIFAAGFNWMHQHLYILFLRNQTLQFLSVFSVTWSKTQFHFLATQFSFLGTHQSMSSSPPNEINFASLSIVFCFFSSPFYCLSLGFLLTTSNIRKKKEAVRCERQFV